MKGMDLAEKYDVQYATHLFEGPDETRIANALWQDEGGAIQHLKRIGLVKPRTLFFHCTFLNEGEIELLTAEGSAIAHCPSSNARKGDCAYLPYMLESGTKVGIGTDDPTSNLFTEMRVVSPIHNIMPREKRGIHPRDAFELATLGSARALQMDNQVGTLRVGKKADIVTIDLRRNSDLVPLTRELLFYKVGFNSPGTAVADSMVDGEFLRRDGQFTRVDEEAIIARANEWFGRFCREFVASQADSQLLYKPIHEEFTKL